MAQEKTITPIEATRLIAQLKQEHDIDVRVLTHSISVLRRDMGLPKSSEYAHLLHTFSCLQTSQQKNLIARARKEFEVGHGRREEE